jgi:hypothetical protein
MSSKRDFVTHIKNAFNPVHRVAQLVGLAPYSIVVAEEDIDVSWNLNHKSFIWSVLLLIIQSVGVLYRLAINFVKPPTSILQVCSNVIQLPLVQAAGPLALALALVRNRAKMRQIVRILSTVDTYLYGSNDEVYRKRDSFLVVAVTCSLLYVFPLYVVGSYAKNDIAVEWVLALSHLTCVVNDLQYLNLVAILKYRLVAISDRLKSIYVIDYCTRGEFKISTEFVNRCRRHASGTTLHRVAGKQSVFTVRNFEKPVALGSSVSDNRSSIASTVLRFRQNYNALYEMCCLINSMHGRTILVNWVVSTVSLSVDFYYVSLSFVLPSTSDKVLASTAKNVTLILWSLFTLVRMFVVAISCQWASDECRTFMSNVQQLLLEYSAEEDMLTQLVFFTDQLENNKIEFTACGIFPVNLSVLCTVAGLVIQYLILLCQMRELSKSEVRSL